MQRLFTVQNSR